jgi:hypothetical protein
MFGLEGSGFTISIGVTLLLVGLVVFYVKQRMDEWDSKLQGMLNLNKALAASHAALEQRVLAGTYSNNEAPVVENVSVHTPFDGSDVNNLADNRQIVSDDSSSESESESDSDDDVDDDINNTEDTRHMVIGSELDDNNNNDTSNNDGIKVVELENGGDKKQINLNEDSLEEISLNTTNDENELGLNGEDDDDDDDDDSDEDDSDDETEATELSTEDITNVAEMLNVKKVATEVTAELDFKKLNVGKLRELVVNRSLADKAGAKKMKKKELVELLS